jgi:hypothetical protein
VQGIDTIDADGLAEAADGVPSHARRRPQLTLSTAVGLVFVLLGTIAGTLAFRDNSFLTHLATGRLIIERGSLPTEDVYSFTAEGRPWVAQSWLVSVVLAQLEAWGGLGLVRMAFGLSTGLLAGISWLLTAPARGLLVRAGLTATVVLLGLAGFWPERPLLFGLIGIGLVLLASDGRFDPRWLVPVVWLWANAHGSFPMASGLALLLWLGTRLDGEDGEVERRVLLWTVVGTAVAVIGPLGPRILLFPFELLSRRDVLVDVAEWKAPTFTGNGERLFLLLAVVCIAVLVRRPSWRAGLPFLVFLVASLLAVRNDAPAALVFVSGAAHGLAGVGRAELTGAVRSPLLRVAVGALVALVVLAALAPLFASEDSSSKDDELYGKPHLNLSGYPVAALSWLDQQGLLGPDTRLVGRDYVGNYLEVATDGEVPVFVDDRFDMYPDEVLEDHVSLIDGTTGERGGPLDLLVHHDAGIVVWESASATSQIVAESDAWAVVYVDDQWMVACPRDGEDGPVRCGSSVAERRS